MNKNEIDNISFVWKKQHFLTSLAKDVSVVISGFLPTKKTFFDESKRILLTWTAFKHHQKQKPRGREKNEKRKTQHELLLSYFCFSEQASKAVDSRDDMLTRHKSPWLPDLNLTSKMKQWKCRHSLTGARLGETYKIPNFYKIFRLHFYILVVSRQLRLLKTMLIVRIGEKTSEFTFCCLKKNWWFDEVFKSLKLTKNDWNICQTKNKQRFWMSWNVSEFLLRIV